MSFSHLNLPDQWNDYFSKYPNGYTILEALINWVSQVNDMTDSLNLFDGNMEGYVVDQLEAWKADGTLDNIINQDVYLQLNGFGINVKYPPYPQVGAKGDGVTDDTLAIQNLINSYDNLFFPTGTYKISSKLTLDTAKHVITFDRVKIDSTAITSGEALFITNTDNTIPFNKEMVSGNLHLVGSGMNNPNTIGLNLSAPTGFNVSDITIKGIKFSGFDTAISHGDNTYNVTFDSIISELCLTAIHTPVCVNSGERIVFRNSTFGNGTNILFSENPNQDMVFDTCSFDYFNGYAMKIVGGHVRATDCHFESNSDGDYWFILDGSESGCQDMSLILQNPEITGQGSRTKAMSYVDSTCFWSGLVMDNPTIKWACTLRALIEGDGFVKVNGFMKHPNYYKMPVSEFLNVLPVNGFNDKLVGWTLSGDSPQVDSVNLGTNGKSPILFKTTTDGNASTMDKDFPMFAGEILLLSHEIKTQFQDGNTPFFAVLTFYNSNNDIISSYQYEKYTATQDWLRDNQGFIAPMGTVKATLTFNTGSTLATNSVWVNDLLINII